MTERYRLAQIAHHAEKLAELINEQDAKGKAEWWFGLANVSACGTMTLARTINKHLKLEETE